MPSTGATKAMTKLNSAASTTVITIVDGNPTQDPAYVYEGGTIQFDNGDTVEYRIRLWTKKGMGHPVIDLLLPPAGSVTCMTDPDAKKKDDCEYELFETNLRLRDKGGKAASGGGGKIIIGPTPTPPPRKEKR